MLTEIDVINGVCDYLQTRGYHITQRLTTHQRGYDIKAETTNRQLLIVEAKGETSSKEGTKRYGRKFDPAQMAVNTAEAFYCAVSAKDKNPNAKTAVAFPDLKEYRNAVAKIAKTLKQLDITVFFVDENNQVTQQ